MLQGMMGMLPELGYSTAPVFGALGSLIIKQNTHSTFMDKIVIHN